MTLQSELHPASFDNVSFLAESTETSGGRKTITHEFVNSNERNVEDQGLLQKTLNMTGIITGPNYTQKRDALVASLEKGGILILVHPFLGSLSVVAKPYSLVETMNELGEAKFKLVFERSEDNPQPQEAGSTQGTINEKNKTATESLTSDVANDFTVSNQFPRNFTAAQDKIAGIVSIFEDATNAVRNTVSGLDKFNQALLDLENEANALILLPEELGAAIENVFVEMRNIATSPLETLDRLAVMFGFGDDDTEILPTTTERIERMKNRNTLNNMINGFSLADSYRFIVAVDFDTVADIDIAQDMLDTQYQAIIEGLPTDTQTDLNDLRNDVRNFLDGQRISAKRVIDIETKRIPAQVLTYSLYGNLDETNKIIELNNVKDVSFVEGTVQVLT